MEGVLNVKKRLTYDDAVVIAKEFAQKVHSELDSQAMVYLYGSMTREQNHSDSDIDLAVVSKVFTDDVCNNYAIVNFLAFNVDTNIDAQAIIYEDWVNKTPFTAEVERQGVLIS